MKTSRILLLILCTLHLPLFAADSSFKKKSIKQMKEMTVENLKDPISTQFRKEKFYAEKVVLQSDYKWKVSVLCGEINSKNSYGAYEGFKPFVAVMDENRGVAYVKGIGAISGETLSLDNLAYANVLMEVAKYENAEYNRAKRVFSEAEKSEMTSNLFFSYMEDRYCK